MVFFFFFLFLVKHRYTKYSTCSKDKHNNTYSFTRERNKVSAYISPGRPPKTTSPLKGQVTNRTKTCKFTCWTNLKQPAIDWFFLMVLINKDNYICFIKYARIKHRIISIAYFINYIKTTKKHSNKTQWVYFVIMTSWHGPQNK